VPAESIRPDRSRTTATGTRIWKSTCSYIAVYKFCAKKIIFGKESEGNLK